MADSNQLRQDVQWWTDELRVRQGKARDAERASELAEREVQEAIKTLAQRQRELMEAQRDEVQSRKKAA
ncbi:hypothetical protein K2P96_02960 [Patescibacteria group bacterium]|nr:hypothetical protein [Patescibacteria group bacterium]